MRLYACEMGDVSETMMSLLLLLMMMMMDQ